MITPEKLQAAGFEVEDLRELSMRFMLGVCIGELRKLEVPEEAIREAIEAAFAAVPANL